MLGGGVDMEPATFGETPHRRQGLNDPARDLVERKPARWAIAEAKPLLGLCRGHQVLNVALGGTLYQDIEAQVPGAIRHDYFPGFPRDFLAHNVTVTPGSRLHAAAGDSSRPVTSMVPPAAKSI